MSYMANFVNCCETHLAIQFFFCTLCLRALSFLAKCRLCVEKKNFKDHKLKTIQSGDPKVNCANVTGSSEEYVKIEFVSAVAYVIECGHVKQTFVSASIH